MAFYGRMPEHAVRARALERDGEIVGIAGHYMTPAGVMVFSDLKPDVPKALIWREAKALMQSINGPALCQGTEESAPFLVRLGWVAGDDLLFVWKG